MPEESGESDERSQDQGPPSDDINAPRSGNIKSRIFEGVHGENMVKDKMSGAQGMSVLGGFFLSFCFIQLLSDETKFKDQAHLRAPHMMALAVSSALGLMSVLRTTFLNAKVIAL
mmetsp:Transcript_36618/g.101678  ORF Transcript_36618/g.101678 Transcript_36618/m.101678 type:complete len:115 (-) Transcript_36618:388-732(-)